MTQGDDRILETLASSKLILSPAVIAINTGYTRNYLNKLVRKLRDAGLLKRVEEGYYEITDDRRAYLEGKPEAKGSSFDK